MIRTVWSGLSRVVIIACALRINLFYNPTMLHLNIPNGCRVMLRKRNVRARPANRPAARPPADVHHFNNQNFPFRKTWIKKELLKSNSEYISKHVKI